jgi:hypothetical protein
MSHRGRPPDLDEVCTTRSNPTDSKRFVVPT